MAEPVAEPVTIYNSVFNNVQEFLDYYTSCAESFGSFNLYDDILCPCFGVDLPRPPVPTKNFMVRPLLQRWWHLLTHPQEHVVLTSPQEPHPGVTDWIYFHLVKTGRQTIKMGLLLMHMLKLPYTGPQYFSMANVIAKWLIA